MTELSPPVSAGAWDKECKDSIRSDDDLTRCLQMESCFGRRRYIMLKLMHIVLSQYMANYMGFYGQVLSGHLKRTLASNPNICSSVL